MFARFQGKAIKKGSKWGWELKIYSSTEDGPPPIYLKTIFFFKSKKEAISNMNNQIQKTIIDLKNNIHR